MFNLIKGLRSKALLATASIAFATLLSGPAQAVQVIDFPDVNTPNLVYSDIQESNDSATLGQSLFGNISSNGDNLRLQATAFTLSSVGGVDFLSGDFDATITADPGFEITGISVLENGSATTFGEGSTAYAYLDVTVIASGVGAQQDGDSYLKVGPAPPDSEMWDLGVDFSFAATNEVLLTVRNELLVSGLPGLASIGKDKIVIGVTTRPTVIPEPTSMLAIMAFGVVGTAVRRRR